MISLLGTVVTAGIWLYMGMIYESTSLALLSCAQTVFAVLSLCALFLSCLRMKCLLEIPISMAQQGQQVTICLQGIRNWRYGRIKAEKYQPESKVQNQPGVKLWEKQDHYFDCPGGGKV